MKLAIYHGDEEWVLKGIGQDLATGLERIKVETDLLEISKKTENGSPVLGYSYNLILSPSSGPSRARGTILQQFNIRHSDGLKFKKLGY